MNKNMGSTDKIIRIVLALIIAGLYYSNTITGTTAIVLTAIGIIFLLTSLLNYCPLYSIFGIKTCKVSKK